MAVDIKVKDNVFTFRFLVIKDPFKIDGKFFIKITAHFFIPYNEKNAGEQPV